MNNRVKDYWQHQAMIQENDAIDALRKVLDPADVKGVKNSYIDAYLKFYLRETLCPEKNDTLLEIGCGIGRLTEYMAQFVHASYGTDIVDGFIDSCRASTQKAENSFYLKSGELDKLKPMLINKAYIVWVLMYLLDRIEIIDTLTRFRETLPYLKSMVVLEQVKKQSQIESRGDAVSCYYRTIDEYVEIFRDSGFIIKGYVVMGERYHAPLYKIIHVLGNFLPKLLAKKSGDIFQFDRKMMPDNKAKAGLINNRTPTDIAFCLEVTR